MQLAKEDPNGARHEFAVRRRLVERAADVTGDGADGKRMERTRRKVRSTCKLQKVGSAMAMVAIDQ